MDIVESRAVALLAALAVAVVVLVPVATVGTPVKPVPFGTGTLVGWGLVRLLPESVGRSLAWIGIGPVATSATGLVAYALRQ